jgi:glycogen synthase
VTTPPSGPRVLWWLNEFPPDRGGIATIAGLLRPALEECGVDLSLFVTQAGPSVEVLGRTPIHRQPIWASFISGDSQAQFSWMPVVRALKEELRPEIYHVHLAEPSPLLHYLTRAVNPAPTVLTIHNESLVTTIPSGGDSLFGRLMDMSSVVISVATAPADALVHVRPDLADRIVVIPNAVTLGGAPAPVPDAPELLALGRLVHQKGFDLLLRAMPALMEQVPDVRLTIAGDGVELDDLVALASQLGVSDHVSFLGQVDRTEVTVLLERARAVVAPSRHEGMPLVALEAAERGRCLVGTDVGGINEVVVEGETGLLVDLAAIDEDPQRLTDALVRVLVEPGLAERLGEAARHRVSEGYTIERCAAAHAVVYRQMAASVPPPRVSVMIPVRNTAAYVEQAVRSALDQTFTDIEVIVVDDGSDDDTVARVETIDDPRVVLLRQPQRGTSLTRNAAIAVARGELFASLDADDLWPGDRLATLVAAMDAHPDVEACFGQAREFAEPDAPARSVVQTEPQHVRMPTAGLIRRAALKRIGPFRGLSGDQLEWSMRALTLGLTYVQVEEVVLLRRIHARNTSHGRPFTQDRSRVALLKGALDLRRRQGVE